MRFAFLSVMALASTITGVMSAPAAVPVENSVAANEKRATFDALTFVTDFSNTVTPKINSIGATAKSISSSSSPAEKAAASSSIASEVASIVADIKAAQAQIPTSATKLFKRQATGIGQVLGQLIANLSVIADQVIAALGLASTVTLLAPLGPALSGLLLALEVVVNDLLAIVQNIVDSLLTGLSLGLTGLVL